jgi:hypothetical protein
MKPTSSAIHVVGVTGMPYRLDPTGIVSVQPGDEPDQCWILMSRAGQGRMGGNPTPTGEAKSVAVRCSVETFKRMLADALSNRVLEAV